MNTRIAVTTLLFFVLALPLLQAVLTWTAGLLNTMNDTGAAGVLESIHTTAGVCWLISVVGLIVALAFRSLHHRGEE